MASLTIENLRKNYGAVEVLKGIDIEIDDGGFLVLVGPSGCGKSTLLNTIAGLEEIPSGDIKIGPKSVAGLHPSKRDIAMVFQSYALYPNMTVAQNISFGMEIRGIDKSEREAAIQKVADMLQIGTRNSQNFKLLEACGEQPKPVLMKRGMSMTLDEYLQAAEYILAAGNGNVILCERGIRTFEDHTRNTLSLSVVPELQRITHLPVVIAPSHGTGKAHLVPAMAKAAIAAGCDGLAIEMHVDPEHAMTDGAQSITPAVLTELMEQLARFAVAVDRSCESNSEIHA